MALELTQLKGPLENKTWAIKINKEWLPDDYEAKVDESILNVKFKPDVFQKQSFYFLNNRESIFVSAHTSSGKTLVAEYSIFKAQLNGNRVIYTSPIKALSNQKFYDFKQKFDDVGLITGDTQVNSDAQCLIMTTEILRNAVYRNSDILRDTEYLIFDEVHYINDSERGVVWEEAIIMLPKHITLVMLSATIPNALEFAEWVGRTRNSCIYVISTNKRPVPLEFFIYYDSNLYLLEDKKNKNQPTNCSSVCNIFTTKIKSQPYYKINDLGHTIINRKLVPAIFFSFSKRVCEEYGKALQNLDITTSLEKKKITDFLSKAMKNIGDADSYLPQIVTMRTQVMRGIGVHHGGMLPFVKECIELLFSLNLIKILIATETFAMGINMPAKCCVFLNVTKIRNGSYKMLTSGEFIQMSGRAGRRGMDTVGTVIIADKRLPPTDSIKKMIHGDSYVLNSQFRLSFSLILMAIRSNIEVEDLMRSSFKENDNQRSMKNDMSVLSKLKEIKLLSCNYCIDLEELVKNIKNICKENFFLIKKSVKKNDIIILKDNSIVEVTNVNTHGISVANTIVEIKEPLFIKKQDDSFSKHHIISQELSALKEIGVKRSEYLAWPPTYFSFSTKKTIEFDDVFALVKDGRVVFKSDEITEINNVMKYLELEKTYEKIQNSKCLNCPDFDHHYFLGIKSYEINKKISYIEKKYNNQGLLQINEYYGRTQFLTKHGFLADNIITLKGRAASEIRTINEILVVELTFNNLLLDLDPSETIAIFSSMIKENYIAKDEEDMKFPERLNQSVLIVKEIYEKLSKDIEHYGIPAMENLNFNMVRPVYDWCEGKSLGNIVSSYDIQEGVFVKLILRLEECCREMINVFNLIGDSEAEKKFNEASNKIKRGIIFMPSLYI